MLMVHTNAAKACLPYKEHSRRCLVPESLSSCDTFSLYEAYVGRAGQVRNFRNINRWLILWFLVMLFLLFPKPLHAQNADAVEGLTLEQCIDYALDHQPTLNQALLNISITRTNNAINLSGWLPQVNASGNLTHYNTLPTSFFGGDSASGGAPIPTHVGVVNQALPVVTAQQTIFSPQLLYALNTSHTYVRQAKQYVDTARIGIVVAVSKSFYNLLSTLEQINVLKEDTARLARNVKDTYHQFVGGIVDETDYDEAVISYNNALAQLRQQVENITPGYARLRQTMGYPPEKQFNVVFDTVKMMDDIKFDTAQPLKFEKRIEYQQLQTTKKLQQELTHYYGLSFLPTVSAFFNYYYEFENNNFNKLFNTSYPYSSVGLSFSIPIFTGFARIENIRKSRLQEQVIDWGVVNMRLQIYSEYTTALANYKYNWYNWSLLKDNVARAKNVYRIVTLQYKYGIVAYLNVIVAESNLISAEIGYTTALFQLLSSKIDLERAMGDIPYHSLTQ